MMLRKIRMAMNLNTAKFSRAFDRFACCVPGNLHFLELGFNMEGHVMEISQGGVLFRPAQTYVVRRSSGLVRIHTGDLQIESEIRNTSDLGYGLQFREVITSEMVGEFLDVAHERQKFA